MQQYRMLVLTDHSNHSSENSLYTLARAMRQHPMCAQLDVATRGNPLNDLFFKKHFGSSLFASEVKENFAFSEEGQAFAETLRKVELKNYNVIWLRMPPPLSKDFLHFLAESFPTKLIINDPLAIHETGSKAFLMNLRELCPPMKLCYSLEDIIEFKNQFPVVLKPFRDYGGKGIIRIDGEQVWEGKKEMNFTTFVESKKGQNIEYLAVKFLKNVAQGDKRIIVVNGKIMGASLRLPPKDSWICNVAMGGSSNLAEVEAEEVKMVERIHPILSQMGVVMYGLDTLVNDNEKRVLSELNTTSIGGLPQIARMTKKPLVEEAVASIWNHIAEKLKN